MRERGSKRFQIRPKAEKGGVGDIPRVCESELRFSRPLASGWSWRLRGGAREWGGGLSRLRGACLDIRGGREGEREVRC